MADNPNFAATPRTAQSQVSTANTNRDGTGTIATVFTAGANGSRIETVEIVATGTNTVGMVRLYVHDGTNARLLREQPIPANTPSGTVPAFQITLVFGDYVPLILQNGWSLRASTQVGETFNIIVFAGDF
jgi:hypothetical protein